MKQKAFLIAACALVVLGSGCGSSGAAQNEPEAIKPAGSTASVADTAPKAPDADRQMPVAAAKGGATFGLSAWELADAPGPFSVADDYTVGDSNILYTSGKSKITVLTPMIKDGKDRVAFRFVYSELSTPDKKAPWAPFYPYAKKRLLDLDTVFGPRIELSEGTTADHPEHLDRFFMALVDDCRETRSSADGSETRLVEGKTETGDPVIVAISREKGSHETRVRFTTIYRKTK